MSTSRVLFLILACIGGITLVIIGVLIQQPKEIFSNEIVWIAWGVFLAAGSTIATIVVDIYDRHKQNKTQFLELVKGYSQQLTELTDKERNLNTQKDCETYAMSYIDLMDQIAYLYSKDSIPRDIAVYFGNNFSYAKTLLIWLRDKKVVLPNNLSETRIVQMHWYGDKQITIPEELKVIWQHLVEWCDKNKIDAFDVDQLPDAMQEYNSLPSEDITGLLEVVRGYSQQLTDLMYKERNLNTKLDCELYAIAYLDLMDQIAFLYSKGSIPKDIAVYFENNFEYAMTLLGWVEKKKDILLPKNDDSWEGKWTGPWTDLVQWCEKQTPKIEASGEKALPDAMQNYNKLPDK